jgi:TetR/AcrR family transcriptional regulator, lmrAB and yxaGH operons repressor
MMSIIVKAWRVADDVKSRMIRETARALARRGLQRASFTEILQASGAPRGSLYHHFPGGKTELVLKAIAAAGDVALAGLARLDGRPASEVAAGFVDLWRQLLLASDFEAGCAVLAVTVAADAPEQRAAAAAIFARWREALSAALARGGVAPSAAPTLAAAILAGCEGAVALARAERSLDAFNAATRPFVEWTRAAETANTR